MILNASPDLKKREDILTQEFSESFVKGMKDRVNMSYFKYGPAKVNFGEGLVKAIGCVEKCLDAYNQTGNSDYLIDVANYCMFEYLYPQHPNGHYRPTESHESAGIVGITYKELEEE